MTYQVPGTWYQSGIVVQRVRFVRKLSHFVDHNKNYTLNEMKPCRTRDPRPANDDFREICDLIRTRTAAHVCFVLFSNIPQQPALFIYVTHAAAVLFLLFFDTDFFYFFFKYTSYDIISVALTYTGRPGRWFICLLYTSPSPRD